MVRRSPRHALRRQVGSQGQVRRTGERSGKHKSHPAAWGDTDHARPVDVDRVVPGRWAPFQPATGTNQAQGPQLFDAGVPAVRDALRRGQRPPVEFLITKYNWNLGKWIEQPISEYSTDNPGDDFAEAVMAFVNAPKL